MDIKHFSHLHLLRLLPLLIDLRRDLCLVYMLQEGYLIIVQSADQIFWRIKALQMISGNNLEGQTHSICVSLHSPTPCDPSAPSVVHTDTDHRRALQVPLEMNRFRQDDEEMNSILYFDFLPSG